MSDLVDLYNSGRIVIGVIEGLRQGRMVQSLIY
jgi:hypothetical protein